MTTTEKLNVLLQANETNKDFSNVEIAVKDADGQEVDYYIFNLTYYDLIDPDVILRIKEQL